MPDWQDYPTLDEARAAGLFHCNCRHSVSAYQEGITRPMTNTEDPEGYAAQVRLRELERRVRQDKRLEAAAMDPVAKRKAQASLAKHRAQIRDHVATTSARRKPWRESVGVSKRQLASRAAPDVGNEQAMLTEDHWLGTYDEAVDILRDDYPEWMKEYRVDKWTEGALMSGSRMDRIATWQTIPDASRKPVAAMRYRYGGEAFNRALRAGRPEDIDERERWVLDVLDKMFVPSKQEMTVSRVVDLDRWPELDDLIKRGAVGAHWRDKGYVSTSAGRDWATQSAYDGVRQAELRIHVRKGQQMAPLDVVDDAYLGEVMLPRGLNFRVVAVSESAGHPVLHVEVG